MAGFENEYMNMRGHGRRHRGGRRNGMENNLDSVNKCGVPQAPTPGLVTIMQDGVPVQMTPVAAQMAANQAQQVIDNNAALAAAAIKTAQPTPGAPVPTPSPTSGIDGFDNFMGKTLSKPQKYVAIGIGAVLIAGAVFFAVRHFKPKKAE